MYDALDPRYKTGMLFGDVVLDCCSQCSFGPFWPPSRASPTPVKVKSNDEGHELSFQFLGNGHIKLRVSRDFVFMGSGGARPKRYPPSAPREFEFVGIWFDRYKESVDQQNAVAKERTRRSPSPRESWFEYNHPMGAYGPPRWTYGRRRRLDS